MNPLQGVRKLAATVAEKGYVALQLLALKNSCLDHIDGVAVCDLTIAQRSQDSFLDLTRQAMALIKSLDGRRYRRVCRYLRYIANTALLSRGQYGRELKICRVDCSRNFNSPYPQRNIREYAGTLIHEATHGLLCEKGIPYDKDIRERVERLCHLESYRFALHFESGYADLFPGSYNPEWHKRNWERSKQDREVVWWKRFREAYRESKTSNPKNARDYNERGLTSAREGKHDKAIADYNEALRLDPKFASAYSNRGIAFRQKRDFERAIADFDQAILLDPALVVAYNSRGLIYGNKGDYDRAIADYNAAIRLDPKFALAYSNRGYAYMRTRNFEKAMADCNQAIQLDPNYTLAYNNRGFTRRNMGEYGNAIADYEQAIRLNPRYGIAHNNLAWLLATCPEAGFRDGKRATELATKACVLSEWKDPDALKTLAAACAEAGDFENAVKWESQYLGTPEQIYKATLNADSRLSLYQAHKPYRAYK